MDANEGVRFVDDCLAIGFTINNPVGPGNLTPTLVSTGAGASAIQNATGNANFATGNVVVGEYAFQTGLGDAGAYCGLFGSVNGSESGNSVALVSDAGGNILVDLDESFRVMFPILSTGAQTFAGIVGLADSVVPQQITPTNSIAFRYNSLQSPNWQAMVVSSSLGSFAILDTGVTVTAGQRYRLRFVMDAGSNSIRFYIDGNLVATITTSIPTSVPMSIQVAAYKSVGANACAINTDWVKNDVFYPFRRCN